jgi:ADP-ribose pyrophosphatase YjhB (NUDIX family)
MVELPRFLVLVFVLITDSQSALLTRQSRIEETWGLPGGIVEYGLQVDEAAVDYVREQCGIEVALSRILAIYTYNYDEILAIVFGGEVEGARPAHSSLRRAAQRS